MPTSNQEIPKPNAENIFSFYIILSTPIYVFTLIISLLLYQSTIGCDIADFSCGHYLYFLIVSVSIPISGITLLIQNLLFIFKKSLFFTIASFLLQLSLVLITFLSFENNLLIITTILISLTSLFLTFFQFKYKNQENSVIKYLFK